MASTNENLTSKELNTWKSSVSTAITKNLVGSLKKIYDDSIQLHKVTSSGQDDNNLSYRFKDLSYLAEQASKQLILFMKSFDSDLKKYINTISKSEKNTSDKVKTSIDQFKEASDRISKLKN